MANNLIGTDRRRGSRWRIIGWGIAAFVLILPLIANAPWTAADYIFDAIMIGGVGALLELAVRMSRNPAYRAAVGAALAAAFLIIWVHAAVGLIGDGDDPVNLLFAGVLALALLGSIVVRFRPAGMARVMTLAAAAHLVAGGLGTVTDPRGGVLSASFAVLWLLSAMLFAKAARDHRSANAPVSG